MRTSLALLIGVHYMLPAGRPGSQRRLNDLNSFARAGLQMASFTETSAQKTRVAILGASGYSGADLVRLLALHPATRVVALTGERQAGKAIADVFPHLAGLDL